MDDVALADYFLGTDFDFVEAGRIDPYAARLINVSACTPIWFSDYTLLKLSDKHGEITFRHYLYMPKLLLAGFLAHGRKSNVLEYWWLDDDPGADLKGWFLALKATHRHEVFVETFHPIDKKEARRLTRKSKREDRLHRSQSGYEDPEKI